LCDTVVTTATGRLVVQCVAALAMDLLVDGLGACTHLGIVWQALQVHNELLVRIHVLHESPLKTLQFRASCLNSELSDIRDGLDGRLAGSGKAIRQPRKLRANNTIRGRA
jgi:hypothetical protein